MHVNITNKKEKKLNSRVLLSFVSPGGDGEMGRWGDGEMGRWGDGEMGTWGHGDMGTWGDGEMGRWIGMQVLFHATTCSFIKFCSSIQLS